VDVVVLEEVEVLQGAVVASHQEVEVRREAEEALEETEVEVSLILKIPFVQTKPSDSKLIIFLSSISAGRGRGAPRGRGRGGF